MIKNNQIKRTDEGLVTYTILSNGSDLPGTIEIFNIEIKLSQSNEVQLKILDDRNFTTANSSIFEIGNTIEVKGGYENQNHSICSAEITRKEIKVNAEIGTIFIVYCTSINSHIGSNEAVLQLSLDENILDSTISINRSNTNAINGEIKIQGTAAVNTNDIVTIKGFGEKFDRNTRVSKIHHEIGNGNWLSTFYFGNNS
ncbi:hypothetical protein T190611E02C_10804 [Tenacibaculum sp. 190524A05c]|uniref:hypothetical protein n=1 Tax=Tenacibaculum platacis TaxID=3137852 RepID=UPI0031FB1CAE